MSDDLSIFKKRESILERMTQAAKLAGRMNEQIGNEQVLVAVSKLQPDERIKDMLKVGQKVFGENRVQEAQTRWGCLLYTSPSPRD